MFITELIAGGVGDVGPLVLPFELGTKGRAFGNIFEINFAKGLTVVTTGSAVTLAAVSVGFESASGGGGDTLGFSVSATGIVGVVGDT